VRLTFLGVRGSTPAPGAEFVEFGGHTSCIAVSPERESLPTLVLDAGTGLRSLTAVLAGQPFRGAILLSHLHWDHMQGIPFFVAGDREDAVVDVLLPGQDGRSGQDLLGQAMQPPAFPIDPSGLRGRWSFTALEPGEVTVEGFSVRAEEIPHKGGRTFGYRISDALGSVAYLPDHVAKGSDAQVLERLISGVDVLIHDAQFLEAERSLADAFGHSTVGDCVELADRYDVGSLVWFHHAPQRTDAALNDIEQSTLTDRTARMARQGDVLHVVSTSA
jgi:phosphoribosyl 1,2-cyclic phosphodiesterase